MRIDDLKRVSELEAMYRASIECRAELDRVLTAGTITGLACYVQVGEFTVKVDPTQYKGLQNYVLEYQAWLMHELEGLGVKL